MTSLREDQQKAGVPPHWGSYVAVTSADESAKKAAALGGQVLAGPFDVMESGRMAVIQDPVGAVFCLWEARAHQGASLLNEVGSLAWTELYTTDTDKASTLYAGLFGWQPKPWTGPNPYTVFYFSGEERMAGGMLPITDEMQGMPPNWLPYFRVEDADRTAARAKELGGNVFVPPMDVPNVGRLSIISDPQGAMFAVIRLG